MNDPRPPFWLWPNLLSLDAPIVAVVWQDFLARCYPSTLLAQGRWVLGLTVWAIYLADRIVDVGHPPEPAESSRHRFYRRHKLAMRMLLGMVLLADVLVSLIWLRPAVFENGMLLGVVVLGYLAVFAALRVGGSGWKRSTAAVVFTVGVFLVAWTGSADAWRELAIPAVAFAVLCFANLRLIETWHGGRSNWRGWIWMFCFAAACGVYGWITGSSWFFAVGLSAAALGLLDFRAMRFSSDAWRVLADAVLLTPVLFYVQWLR